MAVWQNSKAVAEARDDNIELYMKMKWFSFPQKTDALLLAGMFTSLHAHADPMLASSSSRR